MADEDSDGRPGQVIDLLFSQDLRACVAEAAKGAIGVPGGMAPVYGMADVSPDRAIIGEFLVAYQDVLLSG